MTAGDPPFEFHQPYVPDGLGETYDLLGMMMLRSPTFRDEDFPHQNLDTVFRALNEGLKSCRKRFDENTYAILLALSDEMQAHFRADPEDQTGRAQVGRSLITKMEDLIQNRRLKPVLVGEHE